MSEAVMLEVKDVCRAMNGNQDGNNNNNKNNSNTNNDYIEGNL